MPTDVADLITRRAGGQHCLPNGLFGAIADNNLVWAVLQLVLALQLVADGLPQGCGACVWGVMSVALPACSKTPVAAESKQHLTAGARAPLTHLRASMPASRMGPGVSKSGSPAARPITSAPDSRMLLARSVSAIVLEGFKAATLGFRAWSTPCLVPAMALTEDERRKQLWQTMPQCRGGMQTTFANVT